MRFFPNRAVIMEQAHVWLREHEDMLSATGSSWFGNPVTLGECVRRAWQAYEQEKFYAERGYNRDLLFYCIADEEQHETEQEPDHEGCSFALSTGQTAEHGLDVLAMPVDGMER